MNRKHPARTSSPRSRRPRPSHGGAPFFWLFGVHAVLAALANPARHCRRFLMTAEAARTVAPRLAALSRPGAVAAEIAPEIVVARPKTVADRPEIMDRPEIVDRDAIAALLAPGTVHQGIALQVRPLAETGIAEICAGAQSAEAAVVMVLDQVTDPHNVGAVLRSAAAFAAAAVIVTERHAPGETGVLAKAASGALERVPLVAVTNLARALRTLKRAGFWCAGLDAGAEHTLATAGLDGKVALVLGAEGRGLRRLTRETCDLLLRLPIRPAVESLNVAAAAAISLYELRRQDEAPG